MLFLWHFVAILSCFLVLSCSLCINGFILCPRRQLEAVVRIAESLAKMKLQPIAGEEEVDEALRLFQVSTLDAALSGSLSGKQVYCDVIYIFKILNIICQK